MARRRKTATATRIVRIPAARAAAPIIKVSAPRAAPIKRRARRRRSGGSSVGGLVSNSAIAEGIGGMLYGFAVKSGVVQKLPAIPLIGRTGTAAILLHMWARRGGGEMVRRAATAATVIAGYQLGSTGSITGDHDFQTAGEDFQTAGEGYDDGYDDGGYADLTE